MTRSPLTGLLLCGALVAGCGGSGGGSDASRERFIADGDKLCASLAERATSTSQPINTPAALLRRASAFRELTRDLSSGLATSAPAGDAAAKRIVDDAARLATIARSQKVLAQRIVAAQRSRTRGSLPRLGRAFNRTAGGRQRTLALGLDRRMRDYGFKSCGRTAA